MLLNNCLCTVRNRKHFELKTKISHSVFANLFFNAIQLICPGHFTYQLFNNEIKIKGFPCDLIIQNEKHDTVVSVISFCGCYVHCCSFPIHSHKGINMNISEYFFCGLSLLEILKNVYQALNIVLYQKKNE